MKKILLILVIAGAVFACSKDTYKTKPQIEVTSVNTNTLGSDGTLIFSLKYTDKEGDLGDGVFTYIPVRTNIRKLSSDLEYAPTPSAIPVFPDHNNGIINLTLPWNLLHKSDIENDTVYFKFVAVDRAGHSSDTVRSGQIVILRQ